MSRVNIPSASVAKAAPLFAALGDPIRLRMLSRLCDDGPLPTVQLQVGAGVSRQAITKHLFVLESAGLVSSDRVGRDRRWRLQAKQLAVARAYLDQMSQQWDERLERLKAFVE